MLMLGVLLSSVLSIINFAYEGINLYDRQNNVKVLVIKNYFTRWTNKLEIKFRSKFLLQIIQAFRMAVAETFAKTINVAWREYCGNTTTVFSDIYFRTKL